MTPIKTRVAVAVDANTGKRLAYSAQAPAYTYIEGSFGDLDDIAVRLHRRGSFGDHDLDPGLPDDEVRIEDPHTTSGPRAPRYDAVTG